jgi:cellulose synthase/poly-beta-1,6-N-acetylglucosamine synthase-like glycosyltransferase
MRSLLILLVTNGFSFILWGVTGLCRFLWERTTKPVLGPVALVLVGGGAACVGALIVAATQMPVMHSAAYVGNALGMGTVASWTAGAMHLHMVLCGVVVLSATLKVFEVARRWIASLAFLALYSFTLKELAEVSSDGSSLAWSVFAASTATLIALGYLRYRRPGVGSEPLGLDALSKDERSAPMTRKDVAVIVCAHNEEDVIGNCLERACRIVPRENVFVASDGSTDNTVEVVRKHNVAILDVQPNKGKAKAMDALLKHFDVCEKFRAALILDADAEVDEHYMDEALPLFGDPEVAAIAGHAEPKWYPHLLPKWDMFFAAYRVRLYWLTQAFLRYGQTWKHSNVTFIVPGFASMYRCSVLKQLDIAAPRLSVEDFNMTFDLHRKRLGKIAYTPRVKCTSQEAHGLIDYAKQVRRWYLGFWQTIGRHGIWPGLFWVSLGVFVVEMLLQSIALLALPAVAVWYALQSGAPMPMWLPTLGSIELSMSDVFVGVLLADYLLTVLVAALQRKPVLLLYGIAFVTLRCLDAFLFLYTLGLAFFVNSDGRWESPKRLLAPSLVQEGKEG